MYWTMENSTNFTKLQEFFPEKKRGYVNFVWKATIRKSFKYFRTTSRSTQAAYILLHFLSENQKEKIDSAFGVFFVKLQITSRIYVCKSVGGFVWNICGVVLHLGTSQVRCSVLSTSQTSNVLLDVRLQFFLLLKAKKLGFLKRLGFFW